MSTDEIPEIPPLTSDEIVVLRAILRCYGGPRMWECGNQPVKWKDPALTEGRVFTSDV